MKTIALDQLTNVTGGGMPSLGTPVYGEQGCYLKHVMKDHKLYVQKKCIGSPAGPLIRDRSTYPDYDGDSSAGAPQG